MIADDGFFGERKIYKSLTTDSSDKKTPPGGERFRGGANKGTGILRMETFVPRQLVKIISKYRAKMVDCLVSAVKCCFGRVLRACKGMAAPVEVCP